MTTTNLLDIKTGQTVSQTAQAFADELALDVVGLWAIVAFGRQRFQMSDVQLADFTRLCIVSMLNAGAKPVRGDATDTGTWIEQKQYGAVTNTIVDGIIQEWLATGQDPDYGLWFGTERFYRQ